MTILLLVCQVHCILSHDDGHPEILQRERGLVKLEKASMDLCSQFYGVTYGPKGVICDTFEPLSFEKNVQWLQTIEKRILNHHDALGSARKKAGKAVERMRKGNIYLGSSHELIYANNAKLTGHNRGYRNPDRPKERIQMLR